jgi:biotin carboxylase
MRVLLLAATTGYQVRSFDESARRLGVELVFATDRCHVLDDPWGDRALPVRFEDFPASIEAIRRAGPFAGMVAVGDRPALLAAQAAAALSIPCSSPASVAACHNKYLARQLYQAAGLPTPAFFRAALDENPRAVALRASFPCVLKPLGLSGSRGVIRADNVSEFVAAFERIKALMHSPDILITREEQTLYVQVESFISGREFALEGLLTGGRLQVLALFDKPDALDGPFFEETIYVTPSRAGIATQQALISATESAIQALGLSRGPVHAELRFNEQGAWILEVAARPIGGLCARALRFDGGMPLEELILRHAIGEDVSAIRLQASASGVMMIPIPKAGIYQDVQGIDSALAVRGIEEVIVTAKQGQKLVPLPEGSSYLGFIFARGGTPVEVETALRRAHAQLRFEIATVLPVMKRVG